jgi:hypothetical protein
VFEVELSEAMISELAIQSCVLFHIQNLIANQYCRANAVPPVLMLSICAVSARFSTHPRVNTRPLFLRGEEWAREARDIVLKRYDMPNITILTCLLILGLHEFGTCHGVSCKILFNCL